jgi:Tol biopolymer transport system component
MNKLSLLAVAALLTAGRQTMGAQQGVAPSDKLLARAHHKATVDGDLKGAIEEYKKIVAGAGANRALAAQALVRMAECYQKLGDAESRKVYERVIREYSDQRELVTLAHTRLAVSMPTPTGMTSRRLASVPIGGVGYGTVSPDGRYFPHTRWDSGDLYVRDLVTGGDRRITDGGGLGAESPSPTGEFATHAAFSRDGKQLAYAWWIGASVELRIVPLLTAGMSQPRTLYKDDGIQQIWPNDWSRDGRWLAVQVRRKDKTAQIGVVAVPDGSLRVLKSVEWRGPTRLMFSPDGKYLAYDLPAANNDGQRDVFIVAADGSRDTPAVAHSSNDTVMGWSPDGSRLLFASDRSGGLGLWQVLVADGRPQGSPELIKSNFEGAPLGITNSGSLYSLVHHPRFNSVVSSNIRVATFDFDNGRFVSPPVTPVQRFVGTNSNPAWSPDGKFLLYVSRREDANAIANTADDIIVIRDVETGQTRELRPALSFSPPVVRWSADGRSLLTQGIDGGGRRGAYRIDAQTGAVSVIATGADGDNRQPVESRDGTKLYYFHRSTDGQFAVIERNLAGGMERDVVRARNIRAPDLAPDGEHIIVTSENPDKSTSLLLVPTRGGQPTELVRVEAPRRASLQSWARDGRAVLVTISDAFIDPATSAPGSAAELWNVPLNGGERRKLDVKVDGMTRFSLHPDGRQIAYAQTERARDNEVWVLENFLPTPGKQP